MPARNASNSTSSATRLSPLTPLNQSMRTLGSNTCNKPSTRRRSSAKRHPPSTSPSTTSSTTLWRPRHPNSSRRSTTQERSPQCNLDNEFLHNVSTSSSLSMDSRRHERIWSCFGLCWRHRCPTVGSWSAASTRAKLSPASRSWLRALLTKCWPIWEALEDRTSG